MKSTRKLVWNDTFRIAKIINSAGITIADINDLITAKNTLQASAKNKNAIESAQEEMGIRLIGYIIEKAPQAETAINTFLGSMAGLTEKEISNSSIVEIGELIKDIIENNKDIGDFFISALRSPKVIK